MDSFFPFFTKTEEKQREYWRKSTAKKVMFEWSNLRILSTDWSMRIILQDPMLHSESEWVKYYVYRGGNMALRTYEISLQIYVEKYFVSERSEQVKYFSTWEKKFVSPSSHVMFYLLYSWLSLNRHLYKMDTSLRRTLGAGPKGVRLRRELTV